MEKRNVVEKKRTPCRKQAGASFCDCESCKKEKQGERRAPDINDIDGLARVHK